MWRRVGEGTASIDRRRTLVDGNLAPARAGARDPGTALSVAAMLRGSIAVAESFEPPAEFLSFARSLLGSPAGLQLEITLRSPSTTSSQAESRSDYRFTGFRSDGRAWRLSTTVPLRSVFRNTMGTTRAAPLLCRSSAAAGSTSWI